MRNEFFFQIGISDEQVALAYKLVDYSIANHPIQDIFTNDPDGKERQREFRFTGTIGEIVFADAYGLPRPTRSFGAIDGQDFGQDFVLLIDGQPKSFDVKSMGRKNNTFRENYVLNLPAYQMRRETVVTDYYFCVSIHKNGNQHIASFLGYVSKNEIEAGTIGILYKSGTRRIKDDGGSFIFQRDTYEVDFKDISSPLLNSKIQSVPNFQRKTILPPFVKK
jgi:hypothetical protein